MRKISRETRDYVRFHNSFHDWPFDLKAALSYLGSAERITRHNAKRLHVATKLADSALDKLEERSQDILDSLKLGLAMIPEA